MDTCWDRLDDSRPYPHLFKRMRAFSLLTMLALARTYKIVCLHGSSSAGASFEARLQPLITSVSKAAGTSDGSAFEWVFPTAPFALDPGGNEEKGYAWWRMKKDERSFNATQLLGVDESISMIEELYPFDCIIGHSQGAMLGSVIAARSVTGVSRLQFDKAIFSGAAIPGPCITLIEEMRTKMDDISASGMVSNEGIQTAGDVVYPKSLHFIGKQDNINPVELAKRLAISMHGDVHSHDGGHIVPFDDESLQVMVNFLINGKSTITRSLPAE